MSSFTTTCFNLLPTAVVVLLDPVILLSVSLLITTSDSKRSTLSPSYPSVLTMTMTILSTSVMKPLLVPLRVHKAGGVLHVVLRFVLRFVLSCCKVSKHAPV